MDGTTTAPKIATARDVMGLGPFIPVVTIEDAADGPALARALTEGTNARVVVVDTLGIGVPDGPGAYHAMLRRLAADLTACLSNAG